MLENGFLYENNDCVICVSAEFPYLTVNNTYTILETLTDGRLLVIDDGGWLNSYPSKNFLSQVEVRQRVIEEFLEFA